MSMKSNYVHMRLCVQHAMYVGACAWRFEVLVSTVLLALQIYQVIIYGRHQD